ncbi:MAG: cupin domain-containing protein [Candidatus Odinarchaeota archaeon]|nr:cupin domain-containing protein [Candidatus Odinarchaeota archaeon]
MSKVIKLSDCNIVERKSERIFEIYRNDTFSTALAVVQGKIEEHYHKERTEVYHIVAGNGIIYLNGKSKFVKKGETIVIPPNTRHTIEGNYVEIFVVVTPPYDPKDHYITS